jgi:hypothetical protein
MKLFVLNEGVFMKHKETKFIHTYSPILFIRMQCFLQTLQQLFINFCQENYSLDNNFIKIS